MKKSLVLMSLLSLATTGCFAFVEPSALVDIDNLRAQGYSESSLRVVDDAHYAQQSLEGTYSKYYTPYKSNSKIGRSYTAIKRYVDPAQDDGEFLQHQINFTNTWNGDITKYSEPTETKHSVNSL